MVAPYGAKELQERMMGGGFNEGDAGAGGVSGALNSMLDSGFRDSGL
jgi:hypothetical protein